MNIAHGKQKYNLHSVLAAPHLQYTSRSRHCINKRRHRLIVKVQRKTRRVIMRGGWGVEISPIPDSFRKEQTGTGSIFRRDY